MVTFDDKCITEREKKMRYTIQNNVGYNRLKFLIHMYFDTKDIVVLNRYRGAIFTKINLS